eukprot:TRINITY_DN8427_c0_g1_i2.p1 TRINITY_DN8427_c0_g1~~TRINITY_DN8427_c0_g1_i2.p1  ORF type:complete len:468 (-),score=113.46 TRINITY_DN8427_c0_g1_i2:171-1574(-)
MQELSAEQASALALFREVTADARDEQTSLEVLKSCNWNVEQALQLHWATAEDEPMPQAASSAAGSSRERLSAGPMASPLLGSGGAGSSSAGSRHQGRATEQGVSGGFGSSVFGWLAQGIKQIGTSLFNILCTFVFGAGGASLGGNASGAAFNRALTASYGSQLALPQFYEGSFAAAISAARRDVKLLVVFLHSEHSQYAQRFLTEVLGNDLIRTQLEDNFIVWGGDIARMEAHQVAQSIRVRQFPSFSVLLPATVEEIRVIGAVQGRIEFDAVSALLTACLQEIETHRSEILAQQFQRDEDRSLREQQDLEYQQALEMDRQREAQREQQEREEAVAKKLAEDELRKEQEEVAKIESRRQSLQAKRQTAAAALPTPGPDCKASISLRLPTGQRVQRKFLPTAVLADVYAWADCVAYLPEQEGKAIEVPARFVLKTSFPTAELKDMERTVEELKLAGSNIMLAEIEDED